MWPSRCCCTYKSHQTHPVCETVREGGSCIPATSGESHLPHTTMQPQMYVGTSVRDNVVVKTCLAVLFYHPSINEKRNASKSYQWGEKSGDILTGGMQSFVVLTF